MIDFAEYPLWLIFSVSLAVIFVAIEVGRRYGKHGGEHGRESISTIEAAILGLQALMIGFTFSMALSLFEARRDALLGEANAIATTALRAKLLSAPHDAECLKLLRDYVQIRLDLVPQGANVEFLKAATASSNIIQAALWKQIAAIAAKDNSMVPIGLFIQSTNEMFDLQEKRLTAFGNRVPPVVLAGLYGIAIGAGAFSGYASTSDPRRRRLPLYSMGALACAIILLIQLLDRPGAGLISQQPMLDTAAALSGDGG